MIRDYYRNEPRIIVQSYDCLTIDFARQVDASLIIRGIRTVKDFEYEETIADINRKLTGIETILLFTEPELTCVSSTLCANYCNTARTSACSYRKDGD